MSERGRALTLRLSGVTGLDHLVATLSVRWLIRRIAKRLVRPGGMWAGADPEATDLLLQTPWGTWRILDAAGHVEPARPDRSSVGAGV